MHIEGKKIHDVAKDLSELLQIKWVKAGAEHYYTHIGLKRIDLKNVSEPNVYQYLPISLRFDIEYCSISFEYIYRSGDFGFENRFHNDNWVEFLREQYRFEDNLLTKGAISSIILKEF